jgi:hypothetical protein
MGLGSTPWLRILTRSEIRAAISRRPSLTLARGAIVQRRQRLLESQKLAAELGIPIPKLPTATSGTFKPEPVLEEGEYQHILDIIEGMVRVMERSPRALQNIDKETLRTNFLVQLNGHYEGQATGETFNYQSKTDVLIRSGDRNIFIAECKFWGGPAKLPRFRKSSRTIRTIRRTRAAAERQASATHFATRTTRPRLFT